MAAQHQTLPSLRSESGTSLSESYSLSTSQSWYIHHPALSTPTESLYQCLFKTSSSGLMQDVSWLAFVVMFAKLAYRRATESCLTACQNEGFAVAGLKNHWAGMGAEMLWAAPPSTSPTTNTPPSSCASYHNDYCGALNRLALYQFASKSALSNLRHALGLLSPILRWSS
ncbi:hypothetical protein BDP27DRAFT_1429593 [Rhodocollybia butyracea]|uniref:Uncharacterized protein n=1 Tax=Rhodocollybia butyracea TaxID=206335 RepID=A0A9P5P9L6_9AGAR|nr:hypothetical protein BDP27DRAFT_1429593 [Rhodocollybia butyracea]